MPDENSQSDQQNFLLKSYGDVLACYEGEGTLSSDNHSAECRFTAGQLRSGDLVILCDFCEPARGFRFCFDETPKRLKGSTVGGWDILASGGMTERNWLSEVPKRKSVCVAGFHAHRLSVTRPTTDEGGSLTYILTNFPYSRAFSCTIEGCTTQYEFEVRPLPGAQQRLKRLQTVGGTDVTTEVRITRPLGIARELATDVIDDFCHVASVALGTHVQWVQARQFDPEHSREVIEHYDRFTKPYCGLAAIDPRSAHRDEVPRFIASSIPRYQERKQAWRLDRGPIAAYLDAKSEGDLLETRAAKISIAIESLKTAYLESRDDEVSEFILDQDVYDQLLSKLQASCHDALKDSCTRRTAKAICSKGNLKGLNRRPFTYLLNKLAKHVGFSPSEEDVSRFVDSRNSLVHTGRFHSDDPVAEWLFLLNMLDRLYLKLLGYSGPYLNWSKSGDDRRDTLE